MQNVWHLSWNHLVAKISQKRFAYVTVNNILWQLLFIWKVAEKTHWNITLSYLSLTIFMLAALILMNVHLRHCYILKCKICDTNHEITRLLKTHKTLMIVRTPREMRSWSLNWAICHTSISSAMNPGTRFSHPFARRKFSMSQWLLGGTTPQN